MRVSKLKDCCTIIAGQSPESKFYNSNGDGLPFFQGKADFGELYPSIRVYCSQPTKIAEKDDMIKNSSKPMIAAICYPAGCIYYRYLNKTKKKY